MSINYVACNIPLGSKEHSDVLTSSIKSPGDVKFKHYSGSAAKPSNKTNFYGIFEYEIDGEKFFGLVGKYKREYVAGAFTDKVWARETYAEEILHKFDLGNHKFKNSDINYSGPFNPFS